MKPWQDPGTKPPFFRNVVQAQHRGPNAPSGPQEVRPPARHPMFVPCPVSVACRFKIGSVTSRQSRVCRSRHAIPFEAYHVKLTVSSGLGLA
jgi:hypothetical protein